MVEPAPRSATAATRRAMQGNRNRDTRPELAVRSAAHRLGLRFRVAARPLADLPRTADLVFRPAKVAVFVDGCYWHGCPDHLRLPARNSEYWTAKIERNRRRDADTDARLLSAGWLAVHVWEHEDPSLAAERIHATIVDRRSSDVVQTGRSGTGPL
jgi:DNA mismatch endonuclease (patch repair protein)